MMKTTKNSRPLTEDEKQKQPMPAGKPHEDR